MVNFTSFRQYLVEEEKTVYFTFGRMNPPTIGHGLLLSVLAKKAGRNAYRVYVSQSSDPKKNPLSYNDKVKYLRKMFPKQSRSIMMNMSVKNVFDAATAMHDDGFKNAIMVIGSDRVKEFDVLLQKYNGVKGKHGFYHFKTLSVISAGERDPDAEGVQGASATKQRKAATDNDFIAFAQGLPKTMSDKDAKGLFNAVRNGMGLKEAQEFKNHIQLKSVSDIREKFVSGNIFNVNDFVMIKDIQEKAMITFKGSNYLILEKEDGSTCRKWIDSVEAIEESYEIGTDEYLKHAKKMTPGEATEVGQDPDIKDKPGTQPSVYYKGIKTKSTKVARNNHFSKGAKMDDDNPAAYKPAPGDATAKTKPSKHTKKFKQMYGENKAEVAAKEKIAREKESDAKRHDRMLDRARSLDTKTKNNVAKEEYDMTKAFQDFITDLDEEILSEEASSGLKKKAEKSGMPVGILRKVYNRGMAAWRTGHRPGTTPQQWGMARVNSFVTKSSGTWGKADSDLAAKVRKK